MQFVQEQGIRGYVRPVGFPGLVVHELAALDGVQVPVQRIAVALLPVLYTLPGVVGVLLRTKG